MKRKELDIYNDFIKSNEIFNGDIPLPILQTFVKINFQNHTIEKWLPPDFKNHPLIIDYVQDYKYK